MSQSPSEQLPKLSQLFNEYSAALMLYARQWCDSPEDAVQEAFIDFSQLKKTPDCPKGWLYKTTRRKAQNVLRSHVRRKRLFANWRTEIQSSSTAWFESSPATELPTEEIVAALKVISVEQREIIVARIWGDLNFEQLALLLDCSLSSAHRRYQNALQALKSAFDAIGHSHQKADGVAIKDLSTPPILTMFWLTVFPLFSGGT